MIVFVLRAETVYIRVEAETDSTCLRYVPNHNPIGCLLSYRPLTSGTSCDKLAELLEEEVPSYFFFTLLIPPLYLVM